MPMTFEDIALAEKFIGSVERISENFALVQEAIKPARQTLKQAEFKFGNVQPVTYSEENGIIHSSFAFWNERIKEKWNWVLAWDIRLPNGAFLGDPLDARSHAFLELGADSDEADAQLPLKQLEAINLGEWRRALEGQELLLAKPLEEFSNDPEKLAEELADWVSKGMTSAVPIIIRLAQAIGQPAE